MKFAIRATIILGLLLYGYFNFSFEESNNLVFTPPSDPVYIYSKNKSTSDELKELKAKSKWYEAMHSVKAGVNWRQKDLEYLGSTNNLGNRGDSSAFLKGQWVEKGALNQAGRIVFAIYDSSSNEIKVASAGGTIWSTHLDTISWNTLNDHHRIDGIIAMDEIKNGGNKTIVVATSFGHVFYSNDNLNTWSESTGLEELNQEGTIRKMITCADSSFLVFCKEWNSILKKEIHSLYFSNNGAKSFSKIKTFDPSFYGPFINFDLHSISSADPVSYFYFRDSIAEIDGKTGKFNFTKPAFPLIWGEVMLTGGRIGDSLRLIANVRELIYISNGNLTSWTERGKLTEKAFSSNSMSYSSIDTASIFYGGVELFTTRNGGKLWNKQNDWKGYYKNHKDSLHADIPFIGRFEKKDKTEIHLIGTDGGLYVSYDQLKTVSNISLKDHFTAQYYSLYTEKTKEEIIYVGSQDQGFQRTKKDTFKGPLSFQQTASGDFGHLSSADSGKSIWFSNPNYVANYSNPEIDSTISNLWNFTDSFSFSIWLPPVIADPKTIKKAYLIGGHRKGDPDKKSVIIELELNSGAINWKTRKFNFNIDRNKEEFLSALSISPMDSIVWYAITNKGNFYYSFDAGFKWNRASFFNGPGPHNLYGSCIYASASNENHVYVSGSGYSNAPVYFSSNKGRDWQAMADGLPSTLVHKIVGNSTGSLIFAATEVGPFVYSKTENKWSAIHGSNSVKNPDQVYWDVEYLPKSNIARFATFGRGIWDFEIEEVIDTIISTQENIEQDYSLLLFPNPCVNELSVMGNIESHFEIYSVKGELISEGNIKDNKINTSNLNPGSYLLVGHLKNGNCIVNRFVKTSF
nr:glycoside hydrolase, BNR repeat precursor [uncultured bacterium]|tara:strand:- start:260 stop:2827 length:2568 start_codon:yes stop_codon:yes gene_type:complete